MPDRRSVSLLEEEFPSMQPGVELEALVAQKVMSWTNIWPGKFIGTPPADWEGPRTNRGEAGIPPYSRELVAAWQIVERRAAIIRGFSLSEIAIGGVQERTWIASFRTGLFVPEDVSVKASTAPLAICLAALSLVAFLEWRKSHE